MDAIPEEPEEILDRILNFEHVCTPKFTKLIKQSIINHVDILDDDDMEAYAHTDLYPQIPDTSSPPQPTQQTQTQINRANSAPINTMPSSSRKRPKHRHVETPIIQRSNSSSAKNNQQIIIDQNSFLITDEIEYHSDEDDDEDRYDTAIAKPVPTTATATASISSQPQPPPPQHQPPQAADIDTDRDRDRNGNGDDVDKDGHDDEDDAGSTRVYSTDDDEEEAEEEDAFVDPLVEEYDTVSHDIHRQKIRLRKLDRQITVAQRRGTSQSAFVKQHSDIKISIGQLLHQRRQLESHDVVRQHIMEEDTPTIEIGGEPKLDHAKPPVLEDQTSLKDINEDMEEEEDEEDDSKQNVAEIQTTDDESDAANVNDAQLTHMLTAMNGYHDDQSQQTVGDDDDRDYCFDEEVVIKTDVATDDEEEEETGSVKQHTDDDEDEEDDDDGGGSVQYNSSDEEQNDGENNNNGNDDEDGEDEDEEEDGSVQYLSDDDDEKSTGSVQRNDTATAQPEHREDGYEDEDGSIGGGSVQLNDDEDQNENWVNEEFDTKSIEYHSDSDGNGDKMTPHMTPLETIIAKPQPEQEAEQTPEPEEHDMIPPMKRAGSGGRDRRLQTMKEHKNYKDYGSPKNASVQVRELDELKHKYVDRRRHQDTMELMRDEDAFSLGDLLKADDGDDEIKVDGISEKQRRAKYNSKNHDDDDEEEDDDDDDDDEDEDEEDDGGFAFFGDAPMLPGKRKSVLLDIDSLASNLAAVIEEDMDEGSGDEERNFRTTEYETDSDCDSNDSVVVKKEMYQNVTVDELQQKFDTV